MPSKRPKPSNAPLKPIGTRKEAIDHVGNLFKLVSEKESRARILRQWLQKGELPYEARRVLSRALQVSGRTPRDRFMDSNASGVKFLTNASRAGPPMLKPDWRNVIINCRKAEGCFAVCERAYRQMPRTERIKHKEIYQGMRRDRGNNKRMLEEAERESAKEGQK